MKFAESETFSNTNMASLLEQPNEKNTPTKNSPNFKTIVEGNLWIVENFLSDQECENLFKKIEQLGFHEALLNVGGGKQILAKDVRDCQRCMIDDDDSAEIIKKRLINILPMANQGGVLSCVNQRFRFLKYGPGNYFATHRDGRFLKEYENYDETSMFTIHIYLSDGTAGGETIFYDDEFFENGQFNCEPKKGRIAIFRQWGFLHCGSEVYDGIKYTVRTDVMYRKINKSEIDNMKEQAICRFCESPLFFKKCSAKNELVPSCKCPHIYSKKKYENFPCIVCDKMSTYVDVEAEKSKCLIV